MLVFRVTSCLFIRFLRANTELVFPHFCVTWSRAYTFPHTRKVSSFFLLPPTALLQSALERPYVSHLWTSFKPIPPHQSHLSRVKVERQTKGLHFFCNACDDVVRKCLGCGTAHQQLPRSPTSEILQPRWKLLSQAPWGIQRRSTTDT